MLNMNHGDHKLMAGLRDRLRSRKSKVFTSALCIVAVLLMIQLNYVYFYKGGSYNLSDIEKSSSNVEKNTANNDPDHYYKSDSLKISKTKPKSPTEEDDNGESANEGQAENEVPAENEEQAGNDENKITYLDDEHLFAINDYTDKEYYDNPNLYQMGSPEELDEKLARNSEYKDFLNNVLFRAISHTKPSFNNINNKNHYNRSNTYPVGDDFKLPVLSGRIRENRGDENVRSKEFLNSYFQITLDEFNHLQNSHKVFLDIMPQKFPENVENSFQGNGILYAGGGLYNWLVLLSLKHLRDLGSKLPVEVFIPNENEFSVDLCNNVFPKFGAKCILMSDYIDVRSIRIKGYQLKSMALLLTSFENVLLLDSDNLPLKNPDYLFINEPFISNPLVIWPDFWRRSTSPKFYDIANITINETNQIRFSYNDERDHPTLETEEDYFKKVSFHDLEGTFPEASSETGQLLINKKVHAKTLFLSLYYNYYGPNYYYPLFSQGQAGEGDKETILAAAHKFGLPYYQVQEYIRDYGEIYEDGSIEIAAMGQYDPILDYLQVRNYETFKTDFPYDRWKDNWEFHKFKNSETMFLHCNQPKLYPWKIHGNGFRMIHDEMGNRRRLYSKLLIKELGYDFEAKIWETMQWLLCKHGDFNIKGLRQPQKWCAQVTEQLEFLRKDQIK